MQYTCERYCINNHVAQMNANKLYVINVAYTSTFNQRLPVTVLATIITL